MASTKSYRMRFGAVKGFFRDFKAAALHFARSIAELFVDVRNFLTEDIWNINVQSISKARKSFYNTLKVVILAVKDIAKVRLGLYSISLTFFTMLALVPFLAVMFFVTGGFGLENHLEYVLLHSFEAIDENILQGIITSANNIVASGRKGIFGAISFFAFIWTIIWLIMNIERSFNVIWDVERSRSIGKRFLYYFGFLLVAPFMIILFLSVSVFFNNALGNYGVKIWHFETISAFVQWISYYIVCVLAFTVVNKYIPNTAVKWKASLRASIITAFAFVLLQFLYTGTQLVVTRLNAVYGAFAAIPLFLIWLNISWTIILIGAEIAHALQNIHEQEETVPALTAVTDKTLIKMDKKTDNPMESEKKLK
ncbi:MAG: YihY/virulence factor BrkB family protein [Candidatus Egerieousia sp.]